MKFGDISPLGALVTGKGALADISRGGGFGLLPYLATKGRGEDDKKITIPEEEQPRRRMRGAMRSQPGMRVQPGRRMKKGGSVKKYAKGGSASKRGDGCAQRGKTRGKFV